ncbi:hypothetical protein [Inconstantimicrobium mannanitabidum]|uniref:Uncharacterized protein n=1 Tax=Inconstantimicrobium mannanitabidum TaxID=1604901 RepID=A0ACB5R8N4_9CLOT|nr:hypothetical protein [Clostridium sp. TW13]GKX65389.1 hypothetical protein rsdtw13_06470 [Clostridium sp. TW13]
MENKEFGFSEKEIKRRKKNKYVIMVMLPIIMLLTMVVVNMNQDGNIDFTDFTDLAFVSIFVGVFVEAEMLILIKVIFSRLRKLKLIITEEGFIRTAKGKEEKVLFSDIIKVNTKYYTDGDICFIKIKHRHGVISINGFDSLEDILNTIKQNLPESTVVEEKKYKINWNNPIILIVWMLIAAFIVLAIAEGSSIAYSILSFIFMVSIALVALFFKPISKSSGIRFRKFEIIIGVLIIILEILKVSF